MKRFLFLALLWFSWSPLSGSTDASIIEVTSPLSAETLEWRPDAPFRTKLDLLARLPPGDDEDQVVIRRLLDTQNGGPPFVDNRPADKWLGTLGPLLSVIASTSTGREVTKRFLAKVRDRQVVIFPLSALARFGLEAPGSEAVGSYVVVLKDFVPFYLASKPAGLMLHELSYAIALSSGTSFVSRVRRWFRAKGRFDTRFPRGYVHPSVIVINRPALFARLKFQNLMARQYRVSFAALRKAYDFAHGVISELEVGGENAAHYYEGLRGDPKLMHYGIRTPNWKILQSTGLHPDWLAGCKAWIASGGWDGPPLEELSDES